MSHGLERSQAMKRGTKLIVDSLARGEEFFSRLFSSMCFGSIFSVWMIVTIVISFRRGWLFALSSVLVYVACLLAVAVAIG